MDYERIYKEFIASRREMEQKLECSKSYFERHHIIPRALGGDNRPNNLINLKASDHLFSHLLLAKIHGGIMWLAVKAMLDFEPNRNKKYRKVTNKHLRNKYNWIRANVAKNYSERFSGQNNANSDKATYVLKNISGESAAGNRTELISLTNLTRSAISALLLGSKDSYNGWYYPGKNPSGRAGPLLGNESPQADKTIYKFYHISGEIVEGTQSDFKDHAGISPSPLINGTNKSTKHGWGLNPHDCGNWIEGAKDRAQNAADSRGDISGTNNPRAIQEEYLFCNSKTLEEKLCKRAEMSAFLKVTSAQIQGMIEGHYQLQGWCLKKYLNKEKNPGGWDNRGKTISICKHNEIYTGTRKECALFLGVTQQTISAFVKGRYKTCKGWKLMVSNGITKCSSGRAKASRILQKNRKSRAPLARR